MSRGAKSAVFVDSSKDSVKLIYENLKICGFSDTATVNGCDVFRFLENGDKYDLIFIDPPYDTELADKAVQKIVQFDKLNINGIIISELKADTQSPAVVSPYFLHKDYKYGGVKIVKYVRDF